MAFQSLFGSTPAPSSEPGILERLKAGIQKTRAGLIEKIEDAVSGIVAARAACCVSAGLTTSFPEATLRASGADIVVASFAELKRLLSTMTKREERAIPRSDGATCN